jgi:Na+-driven multidrug efflux pump
LLVGINQSKYLIAGTLAETVFNIFFDYVLIFGKLGFPQLGFNGAAIASIIAEFMGMFIIFLVIRNKGIDKQFSLLSHFKWDRSVVNSILKISGPLIFQHAISIISWMFFYILVERNSGQTGLAVSNTMRNIFGFFGVFVWAFASTSNTMVSNVIGQNKKDEVLPLITKIVTISTSLSILVCILLNLFPGIYLSIYGLDQSFIEAGIPIIRIVAFALVIMSFSSIFLNAVTGTGNSRMTFIIEVAAIVIYCVYVFVVLEVNKYGIFWGWLSEFLYWITLFLLSYRYIKSKRWYQIKV